MFFFLTTGRMFCSYEEQKYDIFFKWKIMSLEFTQYIFYNMFIFIEPVSEERKKNILTFSYEKQRIMNFNHDYEMGVTITLTYWLFFT